jgi:hypothetical protein
VKDDIEGRQLLELGNLAAILEIDSSEIGGTQDQETSAFPAR